MLSVVYYFSTFTHSVGWATGIADCMSASVSQEIFAHSPGHNQLCKSFPVVISFDIMHNIVVVFHLYGCR